MNVDIANGVPSEPPFFVVGAMVESKLCLANSIPKAL